ncbi:hypothetical protein [Candidatus Nitrosotenuis uzonensis]|uniref:hypothetical protein n=1 Tax=Candidatus Nitrosotenuis uzonensis TaxID=1407055 RepID=UPI00064F70AD|nr:hypothetical protein [Candidatus Nitrosotenuis uzonensis]
MILQRHNYFRLSVIVGIAIIASLILFQNFNSCPARQFAIIDEIIAYERTLDPNSCISLVEKIHQLNSECSSDLEIVDCG